MLVPSGSAYTYFQPVASGSFEEYHGKPFEPLPLFPKLNELSCFYYIDVRGCYYKSCLFITFKIILNHLHIHVVINNKANVINLKHAALLTLHVVYSQNQ